MKLGVIFQIVLILLLLFFLDFGKTRFDKYLQAKETEFEGFEMIIESTDNDLLITLQKQFDDVSAVKHSELISVDERTAEVKNRFEDSFPEKVIQQLKVPGQLVIGLDYPQVFDLDIDEFRREMMLPANADFYYDVVQHKNFKNHYFSTMNLFFYFFITYLVISFFLLIRLRVYFENLYNKFWEILHRAGGDISQRKRTYWQTSFIMILTVLIAIFAFLIYKHKNLEFSLFELKFAAFTAVYLLFVNLFAKLFMWKQKW